MSVLTMQASDAVLFDNTEMTLEENIEKVKKMIQEAKCR